MLLLTYFLAVDCGPLSVPMNGSSSGNSTLFPNNIQFKCDPGFILNGSAIRTCQPNGTWSGFQTVCSGRYEENVSKHEKTLAYVFSLVVNAAADPHSTLNNLQTGALHHNVVVKCLPHQ